MTVETGSAEEYPDPAHSTVLERFRGVVAETQCIYAARAKIWGGTTWDDTEDLDLYVDRNIGCLRRFVDAAKHEDLDGLVLELQGSRYIRDLDVFASTFKRVLYRVARYDRPLYGCLTERVDDKPWRLKFFGMDFFVATFAPFYRPESPRHSNHPDIAFIFFQPDLAFKRHRVNSRAKRQVRRTFAAAGRPYDEKIAGGKYQARKFIKPRSIGDDVVQWWATPLPNDERHAEFHDRRDYAVLVAECEHNVARGRNDLHLADQLSRAYLLNGDYEKALLAATTIHRECPGAVSFQHVILDALSALGKTADSFDWSVRPSVVQLGPEVAQQCYDFLGRKRKPRSLPELRREFENRVYWAFSDDELLDYLRRDARFVVTGPHDRLGTATVGATVTTRR